MCFHFTLTTDLPSIKRILDIKETQIISCAPRYYINGFDYPQCPVVLKKDMTLMQWGLIPSWVTRLEQAWEIRSKTLNARIETVSEKVSFSDSVRRHRCLVPMNGFFEWMHLGRLKIPHFIYPTDSSLFLVAGIYSEWVSRADQTTWYTFSMLTTRANPLMEKIHNTKKRMPLILHDELATAWISEEEINPKDFGDPYPESRMQAHPVSSRLILQPTASENPRVIERCDHPAITSKRNPGLFDTTL